MTSQEKKTAGLMNYAGSLFPILTWLPNYQRSWLRMDIMAGLAVWAMTVPQCLAYAGIAGVPPVYGLYAVPLAMIAYAVFGTSRTMCVGPESAIAIISAVTVGGLATQNPTEFLALTSLLALIVGVIFLLFGLLRLGWVAGFLSQPVQQGFIHGIALTVIIGQMPAIVGTGSHVTGVIKELRNVPQLIGLQIDFTGFVLQSWAVLKTLGAANPATVAVGLGSLALLFAFRHFRPYAPSALIAVLLAVLAVWLFGLERHGVDVIGQVETGMVPLSIPKLNLEKAMTLLPGAFAIVLLGYSVSLGVAGVGAQRTGETVDPNQELVGLGVANLGAACSSGFVVCGSLSRGSVIGRAGGNTQVVSLINAGLVVLTLLIVMPFFFKLPNATLSAIVIVAMFGLLNFGYFKMLFRFDRAEFAYAMTALFGVLLLGILAGVLLGVVLSLFVLISRVTSPSTATLGRLPGADIYRNTPTHPDAKAIPGMLIYRFDAPIIFANASVFANEVRQYVADAEDPIREVLIPAQQINQIDSTGADMLAKLHDEMKNRGISLSFAGTKCSLLDTIRRTGLEEKIGADRIYQSIEDGVQQFLRDSDRQSG